MSWPEQRELGQHGATESRLAVYLRRQTRSAWILNSSVHVRTATSMSPEAAKATLSGYATTEAGRFDAAREDRSGVA